VVPALGHGADLVITVEPVEAVELQARGCVHIVGCEGGAATAVEQHQRAPVLFGVGALHLSEELHGFTGNVIMLDALHGELLISQCPEIGDVAAGEHVAVHEEGPALVAHQIGHQEAGERECGALFWIPRPPVNALDFQLWCV